jgi:hypothetical protein
VASVEEFNPTDKPKINPLLPSKLVFAANGRTDDLLLYYTADVLLHLKTNQALKMNVKTIGDTDYLFIEAGGFDAKNGPAWKPRLIVLKRG